MALPKNKDSPKLASEASEQISEFMLSRTSENALLENGKNGTNTKVIADL